MLTPVSLKDKGKVGIKELSSPSPPVIVL